MAVRGVTGHRPAAWAEHPSFKRTSVGAHFTSSTLLLLWTMASNVLVKCYAISVTHEGQPAGEIKNFGESKRGAEGKNRKATHAKSSAYVSASTCFSYLTSKSIENTVLFLTDVFGPNSLTPNCRCSQHLRPAETIVTRKLTWCLGRDSLAEHFAVDSCFVIMHDLSNGDLHPLDRPDTSILWSSCLGKCKSPVIASAASTLCGSW